MKEKFLNYALNLIQQDHPEYNSTQIEELRYGLEGFYLTVTKSIVIFTIAIGLHIFFEMLLMLLFFNILRRTGFGLHANKSWICLLASTSVFLIFPLLAQHLILPFFIKVIFSIIAIILIYLYAPADTHKHPLIYKDRRRRYKYITTMNTILLAILLLVVQNEVLANLILFGIYNEIILILPITYRIFHHQYNNYKIYLDSLKQS